MLFPKEKMQIVTSYQGRTSEQGWLVLDFSKIDTEGIGKVYIDLAEVGRLQQKKSEEAELMKRTRDLLSLDEE